MRGMAIVLASVLCVACYTNTKTTLIKDGFMARQKTIAGHDWNESGEVYLTNCRWDQLMTHKGDGRDYCPASGIFESQESFYTVQAPSDRIIPAAIHGLAFMAGAFGGAYILGTTMPRTTVQQTGTTIHENFSTKFIQ